VIHPATSATRASLLAALIGAATCTVLWAQSPAGEVRGRVVDSSDGVIPGVTVELVGLSGVAPTTTATTTSPSGDFRFAGVAPGTYRVIYSLAAFDSVVHQRVVVDGGVRSLRAVMHVASFPPREVLGLEGRLTAPLPRAPAGLVEGEIAIFIELTLGNATLAVDPRSAPSAAAQLLDDVEMHALDGGRVLIDDGAVYDATWRKQWTGWRWRVDGEPAAGLTVMLARRGEGPLTARVVTGAAVIARLRDAAPSQSVPVLAASRLR
jgi:hypothetical protein